MAAEELHQLDDEFRPRLEIRRFQQRLFRGGIERRDLRDAVDEALVGLAITGSVSARLGGAAQRPAVIRNVVGGACVMAITYGVGLLMGASGAV